MLNYRHNLFLLIRTLFGTFAHTDWQIASARGGLGGMVRAVFAGLLGMNAWPFFVRAEDGWTPERIDDLLRARGIAAWGWGYHGGEFFFRVRMRQAHWAQFVLLAQGAPVTGRLLVNTGDGAGFEEGRRNQTAQNIGNPTGDPVQGSPRQSSRDPLDAINRLVGY